MTLQQHNTKRLQLLKLQWKGAPTTHSEATGKHKSVNVNVSLWACVHTSAEPLFKSAVQPANQPHETTNDTRQKYEEIANKFPLEAPLASPADQHPIHRAYFYSFLGSSLRTHHANSFPLPLRPCKVNHLGPTHTCMSTHSGIFSSFFSTALHQVSPVLLATEVAPLLNFINKHSLSTGKLFETPNTAVLTP
ncbi:hypothetical protein, unlikely [Trypanosoma brucei gambiense DAL972]|uniref:Uncharacterized protein n=1 Tax=Trypanosoma brucei gambiense (strain MHOM/CI/86/DAL972) TaxID=679716 RepID=D0A918_TRYB9|nr:hypothetical protein, unlikely [Trypanosoma brucei gambiense DAL972]CBH18169.1 hypothetical protein, unlikely [Trypanosoma brucei gambiense DAL972]|eukprot:XP_011780433.1 hypothetical protein, unlikely [Trypanosoma brucei gambiense DAL972]